MSKPKKRSFSLGRQPKPKIIRKAEEDANKTAKRLCENTSPLNMDLKCVVLGVTPRGGYKLKLLCVEVVSDTIIAKWKQYCTNLGYNCTITYDTINACATIHATRVKAPENGILCKTRVHPLTLLFIVLVAINLCRRFIL
jgi:hypothetical protein